MNVPVTVVVCAYTDRRWHQLGEAVRSASAQAASMGGDVIVVIDHNDSLLSIAARDLGSLHNVRVVPNQRHRGLSGARNTAIDMASGAVIAFLDDDATPEPGWLAALLNGFIDETVLAVGGSARPVWPAGHSRPPTLPSPSPNSWGDLDWVVGCSFTGQPTHPGPIRNVMGCNMAFRNGPLRRSNGFGEDLGRVGNLPLGCEETELCIRLTGSAGPNAIRFEPAATVRHHVSTDRLSWRYLLSRTYSEGVSKAAISRMVGSGAALSSERTYTRRVLPRAVWRELASGRPAQASAPVIAVVAAGLGYVTTRIRQSRRP